MNTSDGTLVELTRALVVGACATLDGSSEASACATLLDRFDGPLRVAIVGRVKAGKSTLLNALVRDRLAATDAGECTRVLTEYRHSHVYDVHGIGAGEPVPLPATRTDDGLHIEIPDDHRFDRIEVSWPSSTLASVTYIDTPGLVSVNDALSAMTESALMPADRPQTEADAVIYLLRHVHERDQAFLASFADRSIALGTPLNAVAVLSRADEIGAGRLDALVSAGRIAGRLEADRRLRGLVGAVVPVAALLAESAALLTEQDIALLRRTADELAPTARVDLASADRFRSTAASSLGIGERDRLLARLGMFGLRWSVATFAPDPAMPTSAFLAALDQLSGVGPIRDHIEQVFIPRASILKSATALAELRRIARATADERPQQSRDLLAGVEEVEASALDFARLRVLHLASSGLGGLHRVDIDAALAISREEPIDRSRALDAIDQFRRRLEDPVLPPAAAELCQLTIRLYEAAVAAEL